MSGNNKNCIPIIKNKFKEEEKLFIVNEIFDSIKREQNLSFRTKNELKKMIDNGNINCLLLNNQLTGFLISLKLSFNLVEINGLYIKPDFRKRGFSLFIINELTKDKRHRYFAATFLPEIKRLLSQSGFSETNFNYLTIGEKINFLRQRAKIHRIKEVLRHKNKNSVIFMKKEW